MLKQDRLERLYRRRTGLDESLQQEAVKLAASQGDKDYKYLVDSMQPIDAAYTERTFKTAEGVKSQLTVNLPSRFSTEFDYQGSVTSDTHIRTHSDIDVLVMHGGFMSVDEGVTPASPYSGDPMAEVQALRSATASVIRDKYPAVTVSDKPGKSISLTGGSLARKVDLVIGNWWDTEAYNRSYNKRDRGIRVLDTKVPERVRNLPFLHNYRIDQRDQRTRAYRKAVRFLKTIKYDSDPELTISSYDITSVAYNMSDTALTVTPGDYLSLAKNVTNELKRFIDNSSVRDVLMVPNGTRKIFGPKAATLDQLKALHKEASELVNSIAASQVVRLLAFSESIKYASRRGWDEVRPASVLAHSF